MKAGHTLGFDDTKDKNTTTQATEEGHEPLSLAAIHFQKPLPPDDVLQLLRNGQRSDDIIREHKPLDRMPLGHPRFGAGTPYSDVIRDRHPDEIPFRLGPRIQEGDAAGLPSNHQEVPSNVVPAVDMENVGASAEFVQRMRNQMDNLPQGVRKLLSDKGMTVVVTDQMTDAAPDLKDQHPRGWPPKTTFANEDGAFRPQQRFIMVAETYKDTDGKDVRTDRAEGVVRHETGHAVDAALDNYSQTAAFKAAYDRDIAAMPADVKAKLEYLLQADGAGQQETFAEVFAALNGGSANSSQTALILESFPNVATLMRGEMAKL